MLKLTVSDLNLNITGDINQLFYDRSKIYVNDFKGEADINICCEYTDKIEEPAGRIIASVKSRTDYYDSDGNYCYCMKFPQTGESYVNAVIKNNSAEIKIYNFENNPDIDFTYPFLNATNEAFRYLILNFGGIMLHASAIEYQNNAIAFSAPSGTGKSTHTALWLENYNAKIINDDAPVIRFSGDRPIMYGAPWAGSTGISNNIKAPLKAIVFLEQAAENTIEKVDTFIALDKVIKMVKKPREDKLFIKELDILDKLLKNTNCYLLKCTPDKRASDLVKDTVL